MVKKVLEKLADKEDTCAGENEFSCNFERQFYVSYRKNEIRRPFPILRVLRKTNADRAWKDLPHSPASIGSKDAPNWPDMYLLLETKGRSEISTAFSLRGWRMSDGLMNTLWDSLSAEATLHSLTFWRVGLTEKHLETLLNLLSTTQTIRELTIDANGNLKGSQVAELLHDDCGLTEIRMRHCGIGQEDAVHIARRLMDNQNLIHLDLTGNKLHDGGAIELAKALRFNRKLLSLSLANNSIGDEGCEAIATAISQFVLTHEQTVMRRKLISIYLQQEEENRNAESSSVREEQGMGKAKKRQQATARKHPSKEIKNLKASMKDKKTKTVSPKRGISTPKTAGSDTTESQDDIYRAQEHIYMDGIDSTNPLLQKAQYIDQAGLQIPGNFTLCFLNLSMNKIGEKGIEALCRALRIQNDYLSDFENRLGTGLIQLLVFGNPVEHECKRMMEIAQLLCNRNTVEDEVEDLERDSIPDCTQESTITTA